MSAPSVTQLRDAFATLAPYLTGDFYRAVITAEGLRVEVTDPAVLHRLIKAYRLTRTHSFTGCYTGTICGAPVTITTSRVIPARLRQAGEVA